MGRVPRNDRYVHGWTSPREIDLVCTVFVVGLNGGGTGFHVEVLKKSAAKL